MSKKIDPHFKEYLQMQKVVMRDPSIPRDAKLLWQYLLTFENLKTNEARPGYRTICHELSMSASTVKEALKELEKIPLLIVQKRRAKTGAQNIYILIAPHPNLSSGKSTKVVQYPFRTSTGSTPETTQSGGNSASKSEPSLQSRALQGQ